MILNQIKRISLNIDNLILFNFFILVFFTFFGTSLPFQESNIDLYEQETTNINNQILFLFLSITSFVVFIKEYNQISNFLKKETFLTLFILFCLVSSLWSDYPVLSIKRSFQVLITFLVVVNGFLFLDLKKLLKSLKIIISLYLFVNIISCLTISAAIDPAFGTWRGIELQKNGLAQNALFSLFLSILFYSPKDGFYERFNHYLLSIISIILIIKAGSSTVLLILIFTFIFALIIIIGKLFKPIGAEKYFKILILSIFIVSMSLLIIYSFELFTLVPSMFGKDMSLSGRVPFWQFLMNEFIKKPIIGYGYGTFWIMGNNPIIDAFASEFGGFRINSAHNGYLEILLQLGAIGLFLLVLTIIALVYRSIKLGNNLSLLLLISILIINISEATIFRLKTTTTLIYISFYVAVSYYYFIKKEYS